MRRLLVHAEHPPSRAALDELGRFDLLARSLGHARQWREDSGRTTLEVQVAREHDWDRFLAAARRLLEAALVDEDRVVTIEEDT